MWSSALAGRLGHAAAQRPADAALELLAQLLRPEPVDEELQPRLAARLAVLLGVAEDRRHPLDDLGRLLGRHEDVEPAGEARVRGQAAADAQVEPLRAVLGHGGGQRDVVDEPARAVLGAPGHRDLELARQVRVELVVEEVLVDRLRRRVAVDDLVVRQARERAAHDVADDVAARPGGGQPHPIEPGEDLGHVLQPDPVDLEALAGGAVDDPAPEVARDRGHDLRLVGAEHALDDLRAQHEVAVVGVVLVEAVPLEEADVIGVERLPAVAGGPEQLGKDVQPVRLRLDAFDLAHEGVPDGTNGPRRIQVFGSGLRSMCARRVCIRTRAACSYRRPMPSRQGVTP